MIILIVNQNDQGRRLDKFLIKTFNQVPHSKIYRLLRQREIKINGKAIKDGVHKIQLNDEIKVFGLDPQLVNTKIEVIPKVNIEFGIVYEDKNILIANKPTRLVVHGPIDNTLDNQVKYYLFKQGDYDPKKENAFKVSHCNRIDKWSQGIVVYGKNLIALQTLNSAFREPDAISKWYKTFVTKAMLPKLIKGYIYHDELQKMMIFSFTKPKAPIRAQIALTDVVDCRQIEKNKFLLDIRIITGRKHQIRAMLRALQNPIIGDIKYGSRESADDFYLSSCKIKFNNIVKPLEYLNNKSFSI